MQALRLVIFTILGLIAAWFVVMTIDQQLFLNRNVDTLVKGTVPISSTDIGDACGSQYRGSLERVSYKLNTKGQLVYMCPLGLWPISSTVIATTVTEDFRKILPAAQLVRINQFYPPVATTQVFNPIVQAQPMSANSPNPTTTESTTIESTTTTPATVNPVSTTTLPGAPVTPPSNIPPYLAPTTPSGPTTIAPVKPSGPTAPILAPPTNTAPLLAKPERQQITTPPSNATTYP